jgi:hypothetical protein
MVGSFLRLNMRIGWLRTNCTAHIIRYGGTLCAAPALLTLPSALGETNTEYIKLRFSEIWEARDKNRMRSEGYALRYICWIHLGTAFVTRIITRPEASDNLFKYMRIHILTLTLKRRPFLCPKRRIGRGGWVSGMVTSILVAQIAQCLPLNCAIFFSYPLTETCLSYDFVVFV